MDEFDDAIVSVLQAANIDEEALRSFTRDDLKDLFPGHENFFRRKKIWDFISQKFKSTDQDANTCHRSESNPLGFDVSQCQPQTSTPISYTADKKMKMPDPPEYVVYTDSELDMVRSQYFALLHSGKKKDCKMSKELCCRLVRNTVTSMVAILRASPMGKELTIYTKLYKRLQNMKSPRKRQGSMPQRADHDSLKMQARHYKTLSNMYRKPNAKPNQSDVAQILDLEFEARRAFIDADVTREEDRPRKIFEAYPCFKDIRNAMDELRRIVGGFNCKYIDQMKGRWAEFCSKVQFYGIWKKVLKPPLPLDVHGVDFTVTLFNALPSLFPSKTTPPKRLGSASEALLHILKPGEDAMLYLEKRPLSSPVLLFDGTTSIVAVGNIPVTTLPLEDFWEGMLVLMAYYYTLHLTYPKCVATVLSVIQTEVITDAIHDQDATSAYKKAIAEWKSFFEK
ncbi:[histone H3]-lysine36 N-dimethyltransferase NSD2 [Sarotherodon galilaeus]